MNGILLIDKPEGWTSNDVVSKLKGVLHERRIGHSGTLDPMATGLLVVFVGRATRAVQFAESADKRYIAGIKLGISTDTQDTSGNIISENRMDISHECFEAACKKLTGDISQLPPMYSAIKKNGKKLYEYARNGIEIERDARKITIFSIDILSGSEYDYCLDVHCSKGTYIRTLCSDIGDEIGCGGCMSALRRTKAGAFSIENAYTLENVIKAAADGKAEELLIPVDRLFDEYPAFTASEQQEKKIRFGNEIKTPGLSEGKYRVYSENGEFLMLGKVEVGKLITVKNFFEV